MVKRSIWAEHPHKFPYVSYEIRQYACVCDSPGYGGSNKYTDDWRFDVCNNCEKYFRYMFRVCDSCEEPYIQNFSTQHRVGGVGCANYIRCFDCWEKRGKACNCDWCTKYFDPMYDQRGRVTIPPRVVIRPPRPFFEVMDDDFSTDF